MKKKFIVFIPAILVGLLVISAIIYAVGLMPVNNENTEYTFVIEKGSNTSTVIKDLKEQKLIKNGLSFKLYTKIQSSKTIKAGTYILKKNMTASEIYDIITSGQDANSSGISITFVEGKRVTYFITKIAEKTSYKEDEIKAVINDKVYLKELINKYSFLTDDILNDKIYYPLEGYLFPDTYNFKKDATIKEIIEKMLDNTELKIKDYENDIKNSKYSIHELMTLASIIELEGKSSSDRAGVAGVFYNRLESPSFPTLGSDVTTYYAEQKDFTENLTYNELKACNAYNTRGTCVTGLPVGPICNPSLASLIATFEPEHHNYYYFVADKTGKTYFNETSSGHQTTIATLKNEGLWLEY